MDKTRGKLRIAAATPKVKVADVDANVDEIVRLCRTISSRDKPSVIVFPELCITGYSCGDLFFQKILIDGAKRGLDRLCAETADLPQTLVVGGPVACEEGLYDAAIVIREGEILGMVPKSELSPQELRWFRSGASSQAFEADNFTFTIKTGDYPSASAEADILICPTASYEVAGKHEKRKAALAGIPGAVVYCCNGYGESTDDLAWAGSSLIFEDGRLLAENRRFLREIATRFPGDNDRIARMSLIDEHGERYVRMANMCIVAASSVNGVAELHTQILKDSLFKDFHEL